MDREHQNLVHAHKVRKKSHKKLQKQFKFGGKKHVGKISAVAKLTKVLQYGYDANYKDHVEKSNFKKVAQDALKALNTEKTWPDDMENPSSFGESSPPPHAQTMRKPYCP